MKSKIKNAKTILPVRCTLEFTKLCRLHSVKYPGCPIKSGSAAHFLKQAAIEKLKEIGVPEKYLKSIC